MLEICYLGLTRTVVKFLMNATLRMTYLRMIIHRSGQSGLSNATMANVTVLSEMIDIRNGFKRCHIFYGDEINSSIVDIIE